MEVLWGSTCKTDSISENFAHLRKRHGKKQVASISDNINAFREY